MRLSGERLIIEVVDPLIIAMKLIFTKGAMSSVQLVYTAINLIYIYLFFRILQPAAAI